MGCPKDSVPIVPRRTGGMSQGLCPYGPTEDRWGVLRTLSLLSHGEQVGCPKDSVPIVPWRTGGMSYRDPVPHA